MAKKIRNKDVTPEHIKTINAVIDKPDNESPLMSNHAYAFYYNQLFIHDLDLCDVDRYANLNTILGYDVGFNKFRSVDSWLWEHGFDLMELSGTDEQKEILRRATSERKRKTKELDFSKWRNLSDVEYTYSFFENGEEYK